MGVCPRGVRLSFLPIYIILMQIIHSCLPSTCPALAHSLDRRQKEAEFVRGRFSTVLWRAKCSMPPKKSKETSLRSVVLSRDAAMAFMDADVNGNHQLSWEEFQQLVPRHNETELERRRGARDL